MLYPLPLVRRSPAARAGPHLLRPMVRLTRVLPGVRFSKKEGALMSNQSLRVKGSTTFFLSPFLPLERRLFLPVEGRGVEGIREEDARSA